MLGWSRSFRISNSFLVIFWIRATQYFYFERILKFFNLSFLKGLDSEFLLIRIPLWEHHFCLGPFSQNFDRLVDFVVMNIHANFSESSFPLVKALLRWAIEYLVLTVVAQDDWVPLEGIHELFILWIVHGLHLDSTEEQYFVWLIVIKFLYVI